jgi:hypothetical protein
MPQAAAVAGRIVITGRTMRQLPRKVKALRETGGRHAVCRLPDSGKPG